MVTKAMVTKAMVTDQPPSSVSMIDSSIHARDSSSKYFTCASRVVMACSRSWCVCVCVCARARVCVCVGGGTRSIYLTHTHHPIGRGMIQVKVETGRHKLFPAVAHAVLIINNK